MFPRRSRGTRNTNETEIQLTLDLDGDGQTRIQTGIPFFNHMLDTLGTHALFDITLICQGDLEIDPHHTIEDTAITLGKAFNTALENRSQLTRYGDKHIPLDETVAHAIVDISNRPYFSLTGTFSQPYINSIPTQLFAHFFRSFTMSAKLTLHLDITGNNAHHETEALFKATARALGQATQRDPRRHTPPTTKGSF